MFEKIISEQCAIETQRVIEEKEIENKKTRERIIEFMSNLVGKQWKNIEHRECEDMIEIKHGNCVLQFYESCSWYTKKSSYFYSVRYRCPECSLCGGSETIYDACDITEVMEEANNHICEKIKKSWFKF